MAATETAPRIAPIEPPYEPATEERLRKWMPPGAQMDPLKLFRTLMVNEELADRMRPLGAKLLGRPSVEPRDREVLILRTCARAGAEYEWGVHVTGFAAAVGLTDAQIAATAHGAPDDPAWDERGALLVRLADELHDTAAVSAALWERLAAVWPPEQLLELVVTCGWYRLISGVINAAAIELEPWAARVPAR